MVCGHILFSSGTQRVLLVSKKPMETKEKDGDEELSKKTENPAVCDETSSTRVGASTTSASDTQSHESYTLTVNGRNQT